MASRCPARAAASQSAHADVAEADTSVKSEAGGVLGKDAGLDRPDAGTLGRVDQRAQQEPSDPPPPEQEGARRPSARPPRSTRSDQRRGRRRSTRVPRRRGRRPHNDGPRGDLRRRCPTLAARPRRWRDPLRCRARRSLAPPASAAPPWPLPGRPPWLQAPDSGLRARTIAAEAWAWTR